MLSEGEKHFFGKKSDMQQFIFSILVHCVEEHQTFIIVQHSCYPKTNRLLLTSIDHTAADTYTLKVHTQEDIY